MGEKGGSKKKEVKVKRKNIYYEPDYFETVVVKETVDYPEFSLSFKPLTIVQTSKLTDEVIATKCVAEGMVVHAKMIVRHVIDWDLTKPDGSKIDHTNLKEVQCLAAMVFNRIASVIKGDTKTPLEDISALEDEVKNS